MALPTLPTDVIAQVLADPDRIYPCCGRPALTHFGTCHSCNATEAPIDARAEELVGEPVCVTCAWNGAYDP